MPRFRPKIIVYEQYEPGVNLAQLRAEWGRARRIGRSQTISVTCDSWRATGTGGPARQAMGTKLVGTRSTQPR
jgi:prophage tail gpP-like protein